VEAFFLTILAFLAILAVFDLFVGVSNDAVNFLNSAIGSRIASFRVVMLVASLGVLTGSTFSIGMMEIARSGVLHPDMYTFNEIIIIFFAVMLTDVLLLDAFNSLGLPTSTTVSIIFELLGGAVAAAAYKVWSQSGSLRGLGAYINSEKALVIISGILISVVVAFVAGVLVQYAARLFFTFTYEKMYKRFGAVFGGMALTAIFYFLVMKGAKSSSFIKSEYIDLINANTLSILLWTFTGLTVLFQTLISLFRVNVFRLVILAGTFSLAFAFAGNDLVNFIGVPLAAYDSFTLYKASGIAPDVLTMGSLQNAVQTPTFLLLLAGLLMVLTLWFSKKAHRVIQTSINLGSSSRGEREQFGSSLPARVIVRLGVTFGDLLQRILPGFLLRAIDRRMEKPTPAKGEIPLPFDQVRASVNLVVASILIASATALKLPLSTTYVTFMVAMGSSFADGAWDRESAVYRVSGVITVISGWFLTAFSAFTACALVTWAVFAFGAVMALALMGFTSFLLIRSNFFSKQEKKYPSYDIGISGSPDKVQICRSVTSATVRCLNDTIELYGRGMRDMLNEDLRGLKKSKNDAATLFDEMSRLRGEYYRLALQGGDDPEEADARYCYYRTFSNMKEVAHGLRSVLRAIYDHVNNHHSVFKGVLRDNLERMLEELVSLQAYFIAYDKKKQKEEGDIVARANESIQRLNSFQLKLLRQIDAERLSLRNSELYLGLLAFSREIINRFSLIISLQQELLEKCGLDSDLPAQQATRRNRAVDIAEA
jgi:phosphate/sulfate permease